MIKKTYKIALFISFFLLLLAFVSCSTKKNKYFNRKYHSINAHYNAYFNGNEGLKEGVATLSKSHTDDYTAILPIYRLGTIENAQAVFPQLDLSIKKGSISIQKHSMFINNKEYNKWIDKCYMIIGKAQYYKKDYEMAISTFEYMVSTFPNPVKTEALLWIVRCLNEKHQYDKAQYYIDQIKESIKKKQINKYTEKEFPIVLADFYIKQQNYELAIKSLNDAIKINKSKKVKTRLTFILAQVYVKNNNLKKASVEYTKVIKQNPPYEMAFNAKINLAKCYDASSSNSKLIKKELTKMTKDKKNKDYLDQIYYCFAEIALKEEDTTAAIKYLKLSTQTSLSNTKQKAISFLTLGNIYYAQRDYEPSAINYDSAMVVLPKDYPDYKNIEKKKETLNNLVKNIKIVALEDSLQMISKMSPAEQETFVQKIIDDIIKQEQKKLQEEMERQQQLLLVNQGNGNSNTNTGGLWYFYNSSAVSFGYTEFIKKWGNRKLEDNWRLSNKIMSFDFDDPTMTGGNGVDSAAIVKSVNKKDKNTYLKDIPNTKEQLDASNNRIFKALSTMGIIYKEDLLDVPFAIESFDEIIKRYTDEQFNLCFVYYQLYRLHNQNANLTKAEYYKNLIFAKYPESDYAQLLKNPDYNKNLAKVESEAEKYYKQTYDLYLQKNYSEVITSVLKAKTLFGKNALLPKFDYLKALAIGKTQAVDSFEIALNDILKKYPDSSEIKNLSLLTLDYINKNRKTKGGKDSMIIEPIITKDLYKSDPQALHFYVMIVDIVSNNININELKYKISDFNSKYFSLNNLSISNIFLDDKNQLITISSFENKEKVMVYFNGIKENKEVFVKVDPSKVIQVVMTVENYGIFYKNKNIEKYLGFFKEAYLK